MSTFSLDELIKMAQCSQWFDERDCVTEENYMGDFRVGKGEYLFLEVARYIEKSREVYQLIVSDSKETVDIFYGNSAAKVLEIARDRESVISRIMARNTRRRGKNLLSVLKKHLARYGND